MVYLDKAESMKQLYLLLLVVLNYSFSFSQDPLQKFTHAYFRSDPYKAEFSSFLNHLLKDPGIADKEIFPRTDTSFFYFQGSYSGFNPFFFKPKTLRIVLTETAISYTESSAYVDTIYVYELHALTDYTPEGIEEVKKEFLRINRQYQKKFFRTTHSDLLHKDKPVGGVQHYFMPFNALAPLSIAWGKMQGENSAVLNITLRMKSANNRAVLPAPFD